MNKLLLAIAITVSISTSAQLTKKDSIDKAYKEWWAKENKERDSIASAQKRVSDSLSKAQIEVYRKEVYNKFGAKNGKRIMNEEVWVGMTREMAEYSWGSMYTKSSTTLFKGGKAVKLYYSEKSSILTFQGGKLVAITHLEE